MTKKKPFLSIGMATMNDFYGVYSTIQALKIYHADVLDEVEIIVVDNNPDSEHGKSVLGMMNDWNTPTQHKYVRFEDAEGTTQSRNKVFEEATGDYVVCMDCHVMLLPNAFKKLIEFYKANPNCKDLLTGPLYYDNMISFATHFDPVWRAEMWGIWSNAWEAPDGTRLCVRENKVGNDLTCSFHELVSGVELTQLEGAFKNMPFPGHDVLLKNAGFVMLGAQGTKPFEIPAQGLGFFSSKKSEWLKFNEHFRGFGGEECYIHEKYRKAGNKTMCMPFLGWNHRFGRPDGVPYDLSRYKKIRNYVIGHQELGLDLDKVHNHFVKANLFSQQEWDILVKDPIGNGSQVVKQFDAKNNLAQPSKDVKSLEELYSFLEGVPREIDQHMKHLKLLGEACDHVTEMTSCRESTVALLMGKPSKLVSYQSEPDRVHKLLHNIIPNLDFQCTWVCYSASDENKKDFVENLIKIDNFEETEMLLLDTKHNAERVYDELVKFAPKVSKYIAFNSTRQHGAKGDDEGAGMKDGITKYLEENPEWYVKGHSDYQRGFTIISRIAEARPKRLINPWPPGYGPGTELKKFLKRIGIVPDAGCACNARAAVMDKNGSDWCSENIDTIVSWLKLEAERRKIPFLDLPTRLLAKRAIAKGRKAELKVLKKLNEVLDKRGLLV